ncbi:MAG: hypothetical protein E6I57_12970 [Chloroflexi bacterium]|nr:MAG: hypothetical protein E6I57_12970 [Chloroflexota bacterium]
MFGRIPLAAALLVSACGVPASGVASTPTSHPTTAPAAERLVIEGEQSTQIIETAGGRVLATLPGGLLSPTKDLVVHVDASAGKTAVSATDLGGSSRFAIGIAGEYKLPSAYGPSPSGFSPNSKWLVLVSREGNGTYSGDPASRFAIIDVAQGKLSQTITLSSRFTFDAIHNDGSAMYLIEHPQPGATTYNVRLYDLRANLLKPDIIFDKAAIAQFDPTVGLMDGTFHVSVAPKSGDWSYGLYMRPNGKPFVHALNVPGRYAQCILDVAGTWSPSSMFSMALTDDGSKLYVVDAVVGNLSVIDGLSQKVTRTASFRTTGIPGDPRSSSAVLSRDGSRLYAIAARGVAVLTTADLVLKGWADPDRVARSLALSSDGARLYALVNDGIDVVDTTSNRVLSHLDLGTGARAVDILPR